MKIATLSELRDAFLAWAEKFRSGKTVTIYRHYIDRWIAAVGDLPVSELRPMHLIAWGKTWHELQAVQRLFSWAKEDAELIDKNPFARVTRPRIGQRRRIVDRGTLARLMRRAGPQFRAVILALRETIARPQEVRSFCVEHVAHAGQGASVEAALTAGQAAFVLEDFKSRERRLDADCPRVIPITPRLGRLIVRLWQRRGTPAGHVFLNTRGEPWTKEALRCAFRTLRRRMRLAPDHRGENVVSYTTRHTVATWATAAGFRDRLLADLLGHTDTRTTRRYQHLQVEHLRDALLSLHARRKGKGKPPPATPL